MHSCIYEGTVTHRRRQPVAHQFQYRLFMVYLDLDELPSLVGRARLISARKFASRSFLRGDHLFDPSLTLTDELREVIRDQAGATPRGPIRLLTQLRYCGYFMSPLNLFYVFDERDQHVEFVVAEVNNTPWNERHCYVLWDGNRTSSMDQLNFAHRKGFHVSPFMDMDFEYRWRLSEPGSELKVHLANHRNSQQVFDAGMTLERRELNQQQLRRMTVRYPLMTAQITGGIYYQALKLWWKKCPFYTHPNKLNDSASLVPPASSLPRSTPGPARQRHAGNAPSTPVARSVEPS